MKERPILFSRHMVRAVQSGCKTQTRRIIAGKWLPLVEECLRVNGKWVWDTVDYEMTTPYGQPGHHLWVRESWKVSSNWDDTKPSKLPNLSSEAAVRYEADGETDLSGRMRPSIFMPRWASRITLQIADIRVERLQDVSESDAEAEGVAFMRDIPDADETLTAKQLYKILWESINGDGSWDKNPYVWVVEFKKL